MSLILEALKKSEARRQLGEAPGLGTPFSVTRRRRSPWPVIVILVLVAAAFGWYYMRTMPAHSAAGEVGTAKAPVADMTVAGKPKLQAVAPAFPAAANRFNPPAVSPRTPAPGEPARPPSMVPGGPTQVMRGGDPQARDPRVNPLATGRFAAGEAQMRAQRLNPGGAVNNAAVPARGRTEAGLAHAQDPVPATSGAAPPAMNAAPTATAAAAQTSIASITQKAAVAPPLPPAAAPAPAAPAATATTASSDLPLYYELPFNVRKDLPALTVSMHVYAAVPAQRFVVVDGERKAEGESIKEGLTLREIRSDGIVLEFRGQKFFYPRPGR